MQLSKKLVAKLLDGSEDLYEVWSGRSEYATNMDVRIIENMYMEVASNKGFHPDDGFEDILDTMMDYIEGDYSEEVA